MAVSTSARHILITGTSRGIGLEFVRQYSADPLITVLAACRQPAKADQLQLLAQQRPNVHLLAMDVSSDDSIRAAFAAIPPHVKQLDLLINNAGIQSPKQPADWILQASADDALALFRTNVVGALLTTQCALPLLTASTAASSPPATVVNVSSTFGSVTLNMDANNATYKLSKAALNQLTRSLAAALPTIAVVALSPGWVQTEMGNKGGRQAALRVEESVGGMRLVIDRMGLEHSGRFLEFDGTELPW